MNSETTPEGFDVPTEGKEETKPLREQVVAHELSTEKEQAIVSPKSEPEASEVAPPEVSEVPPFRQPEHPSDAPSAAEELLPNDFRAASELLKECQRNYDALTLSDRMARKPEARAALKRLERVKQHWGRIQQGLPTISSAPDANHLPSQASPSIARLMKRITITNTQPIAG